MTAPGPAPLPEDGSKRTLVDGAVPLDDVLTGTGGTTDLAKVNEEISKFRLNPDNLSPVSKHLLKQKIIPGADKNALPQYELNPAIDQDHDGFASTSEIKAYVNSKIDDGMPPPAPIPIPDGQIKQAAMPAVEIEGDPSQLALSRLSRPATQFDLANLAREDGDANGNKGISVQDALDADNLFDAVQGIKLLEFNYPHLNITDIKNANALGHLDTLSIPDEIKPLLQKNLTTEGKTLVNAAIPYLEAYAKGQNKNTLTRADLKHLADSLSPKVELIHGKQVDPNSGLSQIPGMPEAAPPAQVLPPLPEFHIVPHPGPHPEAQPEAKPEPKPRPHHNPPGIKPDFPGHRFHV